MEITEITTGDIIRHCHFLKSTCDIGDPRQVPQSNPNPRLAWLTCVMESPNSTTFGQPHEAAFFKLLVTLAMFIALPEKNQGLDASGFDRCCDKYLPTAAGN